METFTVLLDGQRYEVSYHPHISKFMKIQHRSGLHLMYQHIDETWRCINGNRFSNHLPIASLYEYTLKKIKIGYHSASKGI